MSNLANVLGGNFKPAEVDPYEADYTPLPKGQYEIKITDSEVGQTKSGNGTLLTLQLVVQSGKFSGRVLFENLCVQHVSEKAQRIAQTRLKQICDSLKIKQLKDSSQLHDKSLLVLVDVEFDQYASSKLPEGEKAYRNTIRGYSPIAGQPITAREPGSDDELDDDIPF